MATASSTSDDRTTEERRALGVACGAHALHDGYTDLIYVLLPIWQAEFGLSYAEVGLLRGAFAGAMAAFQIPAGWLSERIGAATMLAAGTTLSALAFLLVGTAAGFVTLVALLLIGGLGSSVQHPIASSVVARAFAGTRSRIAIGNYNFAGDIGKMTFPAATAFLLMIMNWRSALAVIAGVGLLAAVAIFLLTPRMDNQRTGAGARDDNEGRGRDGARRGFGFLLGIGAIDSATRMAFLTFLPFVLVAKGASIAVVGVALALVFAGGAVGKLVCAHLGVRYGVLATVVLTELLTAVGIAALLPLPLWGCLMLLPVIGVALNGTSSVLYGSVPELVTPERQARAFGVFYTATIGSGAIAPAIYGLFSDSFGVPATMLLIAAVVIATVPLVLPLKSVLPRSAA
jgi:FSR family fosmidomycin resistance protein-like MFS transporter